MTLWVEGFQKLHIAVGYRPGSWSSATARETHNLACEPRPEGRRTYRQEKLMSLWAQPSQAVQPWHLHQVFNLCPRILLAIRSIPPCMPQTAQAGPHRAITFKTATKSVSKPCKLGERETSCACCDVAVVKVIAKCQEKIAQRHLCSPERRRGKIVQMSLKQKIPMVWFSATLARALHAKDIKMGKPKPQYSKLFGEQY